MEINFDTNAGNVLVALGIAEERFNELVDKFVPEGTPILVGVNAVLTSPDLTDNEKVGIVFSIGSNFGQQLFAKQMEEATKQAMHVEALDRLASNPDKTIN